MDKYLCERCGKELNFRCAYSRIDHKLICVECDDKEQPKQLAKKIADLEAKLAEKDQAIESLQEINQSLGQTCNNDAKEIERLNKLLAEKEKEIEKHKTDTVTFTPKLVNNAELVIKIIHSDADGIDYLKQSQNQTAIAELEKVKEWANNMYDGWKSNDGVNLDAKTGICNTLQAVCGKVNQQIAKLKGEK